MEESQVSQEETEKQLTPLEQIEQTKQLSYQRAIDEKKKISSIMDYLHKQKEQTQQLQQTQNEEKQKEQKEQKFAKSYSFNTVLERKPFIPLVHKKFFNPKSNQFIINKSELFDQTNNVFVNSGVEYFNKDKLITPDRVFKPDAYKYNIYTKTPGQLPEIPEHRLCEKEKIIREQFQEKLQEELQYQTKINSKKGEEKRKEIYTKLSANKVFNPVPTKLDYFTKTPQFLY